MKNSRKILALAVTASLLAPITVFAQADGPRGGGRLDTNGDGVITLSDMQAQRAAMFDRMDADKDGMLTPEERAAAKSERHQQARADRPERDGVRATKTVARADFIADAERQFARLDADGDGTLTRAEMQAGRKGRTIR